MTRAVPESRREDTRQKVKSAKLSSVENGLKNQFQNIKSANTSGDGRVTGVK